MLRFMPICCKIMMERAAVSGSKSSAVELFFLLLIFPLHPQTQWKVKPRGSCLCLRVSNAVTMVLCRLTHAAQMITMDAMDGGHTQVNLRLLFQCFPTADQALG